MIKFKADGDGGPLYGFGLSEENLRRLRDGKPILINLAELGMEGRAVIFYGRTETDMVRDLKAAGYVTPETERKQFHEGACGDLR